MTFKNNGPGGCCCGPSTDVCLLFEDLFDDRTSTSDIRYPSSGFEVDLVGEKLVPSGNGETSVTFPHFQGTGTVPSIGVGLSTTYEFEIESAGNDSFVLFGGKVGFGQGTCEGYRSKSIGTGVGFVDINSEPPTLQDPQSTSFSFAGIPKIQMEIGSYYPSGNTSLLASCIVWRVDGVEAFRTYNYFNSGFPDYDHWDIPLLSPTDIYTRGAGNFYQTRDVDSINIHAIRVWQNRYNIDLWGQHPNDQPSCPYHSPYWASYARQVTAPPATATVDIAGTYGAPTAAQQWDITGSHTLTRSATSGIFETSYSLSYPTPGTGPYYGTDAFGNKLWLSSINVNQDTIPQANAVEALAGMKAIFQFDFEQPSDPGNIYKTPFWSRFGRTEANFGDYNPLDLPIIAQTLIYGDVSITV